MELLYSKYKRRKQGYCNICMREDRLTWDHVPPKAGIELSPVEIDRVMSTMTKSLASSKPEISHDGLKFRTICACCNSLLGTNYDPALNDFALTVGRYLKTKIELPSVLHVKARPTAIARAIMGHLLAARLSSIDAFCDPLMRALVLDPKASFPNDISVFYWVHPYAQQIVLRDALMPGKRGRYSEFQRFSVLKYFPIGYLVTNVMEYEGLNSLTLWRNESSDVAVELPVNIHAVHDALWPESSAPDNFVLIGQDGLESLRAQPKKRLLK